MKIAILIFAFTPFIFTQNNATPRSAQMVRTSSSDPMQRQDLDVRMLDEKFGAALIETKVPIDLDAAILDEFFGITSEGAGFNKAQILKGAENNSPSSRKLSYVVDKVQILQSTAIVRSRIIERKRLGDIQQEKILRITNIWIKQQEKWKIATSQATELKQPPLLKKI